MKLKADEVMTPENLGRDLAWYIRNIVAHTPAGGGLEMVTILTVFGIYMKCLCDNKDLYKTELPEILEFEIMTELLPNKLPYETLKKFLDNVQKEILQISMDEQVSKDVIDNLRHANPDFTNKLLELISGFDFRGTDGIRTAVAAATAVYENPFNVGKGYDLTPTPHIIELIKELSELTDGKSVYSCSSNCAYYIPYIIAGMKCEVSIQMPIGQDRIVGLMLIIMASLRGTVSGLKSNIEWLPIGFDRFFDGFDCAVVVPPIGRKLDEKKIENNAGKEAEDFVEWWPDMLGSGEWIYARHIVRSLSANGIGFIILPAGLLARKNEYEDVRLSFLEEKMIDTIVDLPQGAINGTSTKFCLLLLKPTGDKKDVFMVNLDSPKGEEHFGIYRERREIEEMNCSALAKAIRNKEEIKAVSRTVPMAEILKNGVSLSPAVYVMQEFDIASSAENMDTLLEDAEKAEFSLKSIEAEYISALEEYKRRRRGDYHEPKK